MDAQLFNSKTTLETYRSEVWRAVESQEDAATLGIVDSLAEQDALEAMLEQAKPAYRVGTEQMHYLLKTAFRYPPLKYGSRFGTQFMPSYFYASEQFKTALCETAYYRFLFLEHMQNAYQAPVRSEYSLFKVTVSSNACLDLTMTKFNKVKNELADPQSYARSHQVGKWAMDRVPPAELICFYSARRTHAKNVAIAEPRVIRSKQPRGLRSWLCLTTWDVQNPLNSNVSFRSRESPEVHLFQRRDYCDSEGRLLMVAS